MLKTLLVTTALTGVFTGAAFAQATQTPAPAPSTQASSPSATTGAAVVTAQKPDQWLASKFRGTDVVGADDEKIGDVTDVLFDKDGKIEAYVVSVGGFLGIGSKNVALAPSSFEVVAPDSKSFDTRLRLSMSKDQLKQAANFEPYSPPAPARTTTGMSTPASPTGPAGPSTNR